MRRYCEKLQSGEKVGGIFNLIPNIDIVGELTLDHSKTRLDLFSNDPIDTRSCSDIFGTLYDKTKISLLDCITTQGPGYGLVGDERYHFSSVLPHWVVIGDRHLSSTDGTVQGIRFSLDDTDAIFHDFQSFGMLAEGKRHLERIIKEEESLINLKCGETLAKSVPARNSCLAFRVANRPRIKIKG